MGRGCRTLSSDSPASCLPPRRHFPSEAAPSIFPAAERGVRPRVGRSHPVDSFPGIAGIHHTAEHSLPLIAACVAPTLDRGAGPASPNLCLPRLPKRSLRPKPALRRSVPFTGLKNATKGIGFFVGGALFQFVGFSPALWLMAALLAVPLVGVTVSLPRTLGQAKSSKGFCELFTKTRAINLLAAARVLIYGSRDVWFVVGLPVLLYANGWHYLEIAGFLAA